MNFDYNFKFWVSTKKDLEKLIKRQNVLKRLEPISDQRLTFKLFSELYVLYSDLVNRLGYLYCYTFQVQKRKVIRELLHSSSRRLLELKNELKNIELSEYVYVDTCLLSRKLTPYDLVIWRSPNFLYRRPPELQNLIYENKISQIDGDMEISKSIYNTDKIKIIQSHERARKCRLYLANIKHDLKYIKVEKIPKVKYNFNKNLEQSTSIPVKRTIFNVDLYKTEQCRDVSTKIYTKSISEKETDSAILLKKRNDAAIKIQSKWREYKARFLLKQKSSFKKVIYGFKVQRRCINANQNETSIIDLYKTEQLKSKYDEDFFNLITNERTRLLQERAPWIMEDISDHIRDWFRAFYTKVGDFHPYPEVLKSGTVLVLLDETMTVEEFKENKDKKNMSKEEKKKLAEKNKLLKQKEKEKIRKAKMKEAKRRQKMKDAGIFDIAHDLQTNKNIANIENNLKEYAMDWRLIDEYLNKNSPIKEWVTSSELAIIHRELRVLVDEFMRIEYELLRRALAADLKKKYKPSKQKKIAKKGKKNKKLRDITANRTLESLYKELKDVGIIENYNKKSFPDFIGDFNFVADNYRDENNLTILGPSKGDVKMVVQDCLFGMGEFLVEKPKAVCLIGPYKNGKRLLCRIIASEIDAVILNISPENTVQFAGNIKYFLNIVMKVAKAFQPSIILIENVHRLFWKKVPSSDEHLSPRLLQNILLKKIIKPLKKEDKVMVLGTSDSPWTAKPKLKKIFQKILLIPSGDYGSSFLLWMELLEEYTFNNIEDNVISALAKVLQKYNSGDVYNNVITTLNIQRRMKINYNPLIPMEFLDFFLNNNQPLFPMMPKLMEKYEKWFYKANKLGKQRIKFLNKMNMLKEKRKK